MDLMMLASWRRWLLPLALLSALGYFFGSALYIYAKAQLAQWLIADAWQQTLTGQREVTPWSWADTWPVARLRIKDEELYVLQGASGRVLAFGPGHVNQSAKPGEPGNTVIGGHRDTHFSVLQDIAEQELIDLHSIHGHRRYRVVKIRVVPADDTRWLAPSTTDRLTLITCYPFDGIAGQAKLRYVVVAEPVVDEVASSF